MLSTHAKFRSAESWNWNGKNERLDGLASVVSHDLWNPLNVAQGQLELGRETSENEHLAAVENELERMETLIEDILALAR